MKQNFLNISGVTVLSKKQQQNLNGGAGVDLSLCGCDCTGSVTGPFYCRRYIACTQGYTCNEDM
ncbi:hypothetical protein P8625_02105 [Tenacibaculum tangerinum]|uniref:Natural product n=1 Tax=Tenacibaculum tangerinum TaxID=3038772 RepID=A0ABY8L3H3_9FLAO|nr:hypothetical protein [Tenacibaculum tangerinum]WGH75983.1 hypothetical protein P8625_02105 [Tenacibaculum tangerinum]